MFEDWSMLHAVVFNLAVSMLYIAPLYYCIPQHIRDLSRNHDTNIKYRMVIVSLSTAASVALFLLLIPTSRYLMVSPSVALGLYPQSWSSLSRPIAITFILMTTFYSGPIIAACHAVAKGSEKSRMPFSRLMYSLIMASYHDDSKWKIVRALVAAPITEELVFRSVMIASMVTGLRARGEADPWMVVYLNPLCFGLAHVHHFIEKMDHGWDLRDAIASTAVQVTYTSIFGCIATLLFMRTGCIYSAMLSHVICNSAGLPHTGFMHPRSDDDRDLCSYSQLYPYRHMHNGLHALGLFIFALLILPLTETMSNESILWNALLAKQQS